MTITPKIIITAIPFLLLATDTQTSIESVGGLAGQFLKYGELGLCFALVAYLVYSNYCLMASLNRLMHERFGSRSPGVSALRQALEEVEAALRGIARDKGVLDVPAPEAETDGQADEQPAAAAARSGAAGPISSRDDAYRRLEEVARYLRMHDRHSPVPLLLQKILSWKDLPFDQLLREIVRDANARAQAYELLGVRDASEDSSSSEE